MSSTTPCELSMAHQLKTLDGATPLTSPTDGPSAQTPTTPSTNGFGIPKQPEHPTLVRYSEDYPKLNSELQIAFGDAMANGPFVTSTRYKKVNVLLLSWEPDFDELKVKEEVDRLKAVFENRYKFEVQSTQLKRHEFVKAQNQINKIVADWVYDYGHTNTLLIVYFAGHGRPGKKPGELEMNGRQARNDILREHLDSVIWNKTEPLLSSTHADVLQIFDCCYAGNLGPVRGPAHVMEYLAATSANTTTKCPGDKSFTNALIWALNKFADEKRRFTTSDLLSRIDQDAPHFPREQHPVLIKRSESQSELIVLDPTAGVSNSAEPVKVGSDVDSRGREVLTLKLVLETRPDAKDVRAFGNDLICLVSKKDLRVNRIMWGGIQPANQPLVAAAYKWKSVLERKLSRPSHGLRLPEDATATQLIHEMEDRVVDEVLAREGHSEGLTGPPSRKRARQ